MEYRQKDFGSYRLHMIQVDKFKSIKMRVMFQRPIEKEDITIRNFLTNILTLSCKEYKTKRALAIKSQELYAANVTAYNRRIGSIISTNVSLSALNEKYTEPGMLEQSIQLLSQIIFEPHVENGQFDSESFQIVKNDIEMMFSSVKEDYNKYSLIRLLEEMDEDVPFSYRGIGYQEDLEKITEANLYEYYQDMIKKDQIDIYVIGEFDFNEMERLVKENFPFYTLKKQKKIDSLIPCTTVRKKVKEVKEQEEVKQAKLAIGCRLVNLTNYERKYPLTLFHLIFGGGSDSKLFQVVREKHSLAYTISSSLSKMDNLLFIRGGIDSENEQKAVKLIKEQLEAMTKGDFTEEAIAKAKQIYLTAIEEMEDSMGQIINNYVMMDLTDADDIETKKKMMQKVTKQDIIDVSKKVKIDTIYMLEGGK